MSYGVGWFGRVFGTLGMFGSVVFFCNGGMFGAGVFLVRECFWCGTDHLPEIYPPPLAFLGAPPNPRRAGKRNGKRLANQKGMLIFNLNC